MLSVLDRLVDDEPSFQGDEPQPDYHVGLAQLERALSRDLQWLLNARTDVRVKSDADDPLDGTVLRLGLPDITTIDLKSARDRDLLRRRIRECIETYEPRLDFVTVKVDADPGRDRTRFKVEARLKVDPEPVRLCFDATVLWRNRSVEVNR